MVRINEQNSQKTVTIQQLSPPQSYKKNEESHTVSHVCHHLCAAAPLPFQRGGAQGWGDRKPRARKIYTPPLHPSPKMGGERLRRKTCDQGRTLASRENKFERGHSSDSRNLCKRAKTSIVQTPKLPYSQTPTLDLWSLCLQRTPKHPTLDLGRFACSELQLLPKKQAP